MSCPEGLRKIFKKNKVISKTIFNKMLKVNRLQKQHLKLRNEINEYLLNNKIMSETELEDCGPLIDILDYGYGGKSILIKELKKIGIEVE